MAHPDEPQLYLSLTIDADTDANKPVAGRPDAVSAGCDRSEWQACLTGLDIILTELEDRQLPATFFWEGRIPTVVGQVDGHLLDRLTGNRRLEHGCHGLRHEDFAGKVSGRALPASDTRRILQEAGQVISSLMGARPRGFRAPYCRLTDALCAALSALGYTYDASLTHDLAEGQGLEACELDGAPGVAELPLARARDEDGRPISGYLWQLFEGNREPAEYAALARRAADACPGGLLQIALHPWHLFVGTDGLPRPQGPERLATVLDCLQGLDSVEFTTNIGYVERTDASRR